MAVMTMTDYGHARSQAAKLANERLPVMWILVSSAVPPSATEFTGPIVYRIPVATGDVRVDSDHPDQIVITGLIGADVTGGFVVNALAVVDDQYFGADGETPVDGIQGVLAVGRAAGDIKRGPEHEFPASYEVIIVMREASADVVDVYFAGNKSLEERVAALESGGGSGGGGGDMQPFTVTHVSPGFNGDTIYTAEVYGNRMVFKRAPPGSAEGNISLGYTGASSALSVWDGAVEHEPIMQRTAYYQSALRGTIAVEVTVPAGSTVAASADLPEEFKIDGVFILSVKHKQVNWAAWEYSGVDANVGFLHPGGGNNPIMVSANLPVARPVDLKVSVLVGRI